MLCIVSLPEAKTEILVWDTPSALSQEFEYRLLIWNMIPGNRVRDRRDKEGRRTTKGWVIYQVISGYRCVWLEPNLRGTQWETMWKLPQDCPTRGREPVLFPQKLLSFMDWEFLLGAWTLQYSDHFTHWGMHSSVQRTPSHRQTIKYIGKLSADDLRWTKEIWAGHQQYQTQQTYWSRSGEKSKKANACLHSS